MSLIKTIYDFGFDRLLNKIVNSVSTGLVYDPIGSSLNVAQVLSGGQLTLKSLSIGGLIKQVAPGDDIQAAIDAVNRDGGGVVQFLAKTYRINSPINLRANVSLIGAGIGSTIIDLSAISGSKLIFNGIARTIGGSITTTEGSTAVTRSGTTFTNASSGDYLLVTANDYNFYSKISSITNATNLVLEKAWPMPSGAGVTGFSIMDALVNCKLKDLTIDNGNNSGLGSVIVNRVITFVAENVL